MESKRNLALPQTSDIYISKTFLNKATTPLGQLNKYKGNSITWLPLAESMQLLPIVTVKILSWRNDPTVVL